MTEAMWIFEAMALREEDKRQQKSNEAWFKVSARAFRDTLIALLGLDRGINRHEVDLSDPEAPRPFVPLVFTCGRPDAVKTIMEKQEEERTIDQATKDRGFDELSEALASSQLGDMEPLYKEFARQDGNESLFKDEQFQNLLKSLGIQVMEDPTQPPLEPHPERR